jgi:hypothetical protein
MYSIKKGETEQLNWAADPDPQTGNKPIIVTARE